jgi:hypothetical protein
VLISYCYEDHCKYLTDPTTNSFASPPLLSSAFPILSNLLSSRSCIGAVGEVPEDAEKKEDEKKEKKAVRGC